MPPTGARHKHGYLALRLLQEEPQIWRWLPASFRVSPGLDALPRYYRVVRAELHERFDMCPITARRTRQSSGQGHESMSSVVRVDDVVTLLKKLPPRGSL
jgi:hypothetical protein